MNPPSPAVGPFPAEESGADRITQKVVIALRDSTRLRGFLAQPQAEGFRVFDAVDNRDGSRSDLFDREEFVRRFGRDPRNAEMGCTLSHMGVMREFAAADGADEDLLLIAEDDLRFSEDFEDVAGSCASQMGSRAMVILGDPYGPAGRRDTGVASKSEHFVQLSLLASRIRAPRSGTLYRLGRWGAGLTGAGSYLVSRGATRRIIAHIDGPCDGRPWWVADFHGFYRDDLDVDVLFVRPNLGAWEGESTVQDETHAAWRASSTSASSAVPVRVVLEERLHRLLLTAKSTKFDFRWRLTHH